MFEVKNIDVYYGDVQALWDVSFSVAAGQVVTLVGANGAGKTTTLRTLSGLLHPRRGQVLLQGEDVSQVPPHKLVEQGLALVPEGRQLWPNMTVQENLEMGAYTPAARAHLKDSLERIYVMFPRLKERARQLAGTMSGGEQQMCAIGRGLMSQPKVLMLDEPSLGLAPMLVKEVFETVQRVAAAGITVLLVEQNVHSALAVADYAYVLETGRVTLAGPAQELLGDPRVKERFLGM